MRNVQIILFALFLFSANLLSAQQTVDALIDKVHANDCSDAGLMPNEYEYHRVFGFRIAFDYLKHKGLKVAAHTEGRLT
ncbi:MAG: hypothetical protein FWE67_11430, partial [Planctomycetaceae bacterium]|nr:hypothetical protein [Planctomycetaceae bacterium]